MNTFISLVALSFLVTATVCSEKKKESGMSDSKKHSENECPRDESYYHYNYGHHLMYGGHADAYGDKMVEYFKKSRVTMRQQECFDKFKSGDSVDFIIDLAPSPSMDRADKLSSRAPIGLFLDESLRYGGRQSSATRSYIDSIGLFIDTVTLGMKPELTHSVIVDPSDKREKFYLRGRYINATFDSLKLGGAFVDKHRNLKTMWPVSTRSLPESKMSKIQVNNLSRMTKLALWNRDNGLPTVLHADRHSKPFYSIVLTDGSSGASLRDLVGENYDLSRVTVIDVGQHRFVDRLKWDEFERIRGGVFTLIAPQTLPAFISSVRNMACLFGSNRASSSSFYAGSSGSSSSSSSLRSH